MSISKKDGRQFPLMACVDIGWADFVSGTLEAAVELPAGAIVIGGNLLVTEVFDSVTSDNMTVGDALDEDRYLGATSMQALGLTPLVPTGFIPTGITNVTLTLTSVGGGIAAGAGKLMVEYIVPGRGQTTQG